MSSAAISQTIASHTKARVQERAADAERFAALHEELRSRGVKDLDRLTMFLQRVSDEKAVMQMLRSESEARADGSDFAASSSQSRASSAGAGASSVAQTATKAAVSASEGGSDLAAAAAGARRYVDRTAGWLVERPYLSGSYLEPGTRERLAAGGLEAAAPKTASAGSSLGALPIEQQQELLVTDLLCVLVGVEGAHIRAAPDRAAPSAAAAGSSARWAAGGRVQFVLPRTDGGASASGSSSATPPRAGIDPSLIDLARRLLPAGEQYVALSHFVHSRSCSLESGLVMHALCAALRACLHEHAVGIAQLEQQHRTEGLSMQQLHFYLQPALRSLATMSEIVGAVGESRGGALLRALHERRTLLSGDVDGSNLLEYLLNATAVPFLEMLALWVYEGQCNDPYAEFMVVERPTEAKADLVTDFNCLYWQRRFYLAPDQVPAFLEPHATDILTTGKSLHVIRECGRIPDGHMRRDSSVPSASGAAPPPRLTLDERSLSAQLKAASASAASQLVSLLMDDHRLMARLSSIKHYFLLDQGDFFVHFLDSAEEELTKPVGEISRARLQAKLELSLRQSAVADPYRESLTCDLLPYNLTNQLLRIINASRAAGSSVPPAPQPASRTPGLDAFTFDYAVEWPLSLVLSKHALTKYQLLFRHLFHCKHVERQLSASWLSQQEPKQLVGTAAALSASFGLRQRMLHFLFNIQHYMLFEVLEPNWHVLQQKLRAASTLDAILTHHAEFLDSSLRECMLRDAVLLKLLAKLLTICVIFADQTRIVMADVAAHLDARKLPPFGKERRFALDELSATISATISDCRYHQNVVKLAAKFDEELKRLLDELRRQAHREWNLAHLCARLDFNSYWTSSSHANLGPAASIATAAGAS